MPPPETAAAAEGCPLDPAVWNAVAGSSAARLPSPGSRVYYFPQGHAEQASSPPDLPCPLPPLALCRVSAVSLLSDSDTDEAFARIFLLPLHPYSPRSLPPPLADAGGAAVAFAKILTPSDANNGGGFSVPRFCADSIFPPLDFDADPPVQNLSTRDIHGRTWAFRHIYRGTPRRHLLTTGWSKFVNCKRLVAGDSVVFVRDHAGGLFVGVRRAYTKAEEVGSGGSGDQVGFSRASRGRVPAASVTEAVRLLEMGLPFDVIYYPRAGSPEFVVAEETVEAAMAVEWSSGMQVRMAGDTEDSSRTTWFKGTVSAAAIPDTGPWPQSPWRMLQVMWDDPEVPRYAKSVSPWQVELVPDTIPLLTPQPTLKKLRVAESSELPSVIGGLEKPSDSDGKMFFQMNGFNPTKVESIKPSLFNYNTIPVGIQGARHDICVASLAHFVPTNTHKMLSDDLCGINMPHNLKNVSTELSIGGVSQSQGSSPPSHDSINNTDTELLNAAAFSSTRKASESCFQLFGQVIRMKRPVDVDFVKEYSESKDEVESLDYSLSYPHKQLLKDLDVQC